MFLERAAALRAAELLEVEDFYREAHKVVFQVMEELLDKGEDINLISVIDRLRLEKQLEAVGDYPYVYSLYKGIPTTAHLEQFARIVKEASVKRRLLRLGREVIARVNESEDSATQLDMAQSSLNELLGLQNNSNFIDLPVLINEYLTEVSTLDAAQQGHLGLATGYVQLDALLHGLKKAELIILAARPSMGKTALALNLVLNIILQEPKTSVGFFSLEMGRKELLNRLLAILTGIDSTKIDSNQLSIEEWDQLHAAQQQLAECHLAIDDSVGLTINSMRSRAKKLQVEKGLDLLVIDYLQLMSGTGNTRNDRQEDLAEISRGLKALARELDIPIIALAQLSRAVELHQDKRPYLSSLRGSGAIEQDSDVVMFIYRDDYYNRASREPGVTELIVAKHRNGPTGVIKLLFVKQLTKFVQILKGDEGV